MASVAVFNLPTYALAGLFLCRCDCAYTSTPTWNQMEGTLCHCDRLTKEMNVVVGRFWSRHLGQGINKGSRIQLSCGVYTWER